MKPGEEGFSYMETLIALLILSVLVSGAALFASALLRAPEIILSSSRSTAALAVLDTEFRRACGSITLPWWLSAPPSSLLEISPGEVTVRKGADDDMYLLNLRIAETNRGAQLVIRNTQTDNVERICRIPEDYSARFEIFDSGIRLLLETPEETVAIDGGWQSRSLFGEEDVP